VPIASFRLKQIRLIAPGDQRSELIEAKARMMAVGTVFRAF